VYLQMRVSVDQEGKSTQEDGGKRQLLEAAASFLLSVVEDLDFCLTMYPSAKINTHSDSCLSKQSH